MKGSISRRRQDVVPGLGSPALTLDDHPGRMARSLAGRAFCGAGSRASWRSPARPSPPRAAFGVDLGGAQEDLHAPGNGGGVLTP